MSNVEHGTSIGVKVCKAALSWIRGSCDITTYVSSYYAQSNLPAVWGDDLKQWNKRKTVEIYQLVVILDMK